MSISKREESIVEEVRFGICGWRFWKGVLVIVRVRSAPEGSKSVPTNSEGAQASIPRFPVQQTHPFPIIENNKRPLLKPRNWAFTFPPLVPWSASLCQLSLPVPQIAKSLQTQRLALYRSLTRSLAERKISTVTLLFALIVPNSL
jgi:hypothetical protein